MHMLTDTHTHVVITQYVKTVKTVLIMISRSEHLRFFLVVALLQCCCALHLRSQVSHGRHGHPLVCCTGLAGALSFFFT